MSLDFDAIAEALALRYASLTPPTGEPAIRASTSHPPNALPPGAPYVVVWTMSGEVIYGSGERKGQTEYEVRLYIDLVGDLPRQMATTQKWIGLMLDATHAATKITLAPTVDKALPTGWSIGVYEYGDKLYEGISIIVRVWTTDTVTLVP